MRNCLIALVLAMTTTAAAQGRRPYHPPPPPPPHHDPPVIDGGGLEVSGKLRTAMLLQFLERAGEELERASLPQRSFVPELVRSVESEDL